MCYSREEDLICFYLAGAIADPAMATAALPSTALKMKNTNTATIAKTKTSGLSPSVDLKKSSDSPEIIEIDMTGSSNNTSSTRLGKKGQEKAGQVTDKDKENLANSAPEEEEGEEEEGEDDEVAIIGTTPQSSDGVNKQQRDPIRRRKINDYITDRYYRMRSFLRRRGVPLLRTLEMDIQECVTKCQHLCTKFN
jgi:hypothetical protein